MPLISRPELLKRVTASLQLSGWDAMVRDDRHPFSIWAASGLERRRLQVYIWNITHGGGAARAEGEYRIQITGVATPLSAPSGVQILLLGWHEDLEVFAAFDPVLHRRPSAASPSIQIPMATLRLASQGRLARHVRGNGETALAFPPSRMGRYVLHQQYLHLSLEEPDDSLDELDEGLTATDSDEILMARDAVGEAAGKVRTDGPSAGQRILVDTMTRRAIELYAMQLAVEHLERQSWSVIDVSPYAPYDLQCSKRSRTLHVEVKGTTSSGRSVLLTPNEVHHARTTRAEIALFVVANIQVGEHRGHLQVAGGDVQLIMPWAIVEDNLRPVGYEYVIGTA